MLKSKVAQSLSTIVLKPLGLGNLINISDAVVLGRSNRCDVVISHGGVSRRHAKLTPGKWALHVQDLGSINGTFVNEKRVSNPVPAKHKDKIRFDSLVYEVRIAIDVDSVEDVKKTVSPPALVPSTGDLAVINDTVPPVVSQLNVIKKEVRNTPVKSVKPTPSVKKSADQPATQGGFKSTVQGQRSSPVTSPKHKKKPPAAANWAIANPCQAKVLSGERSGDVVRETVQIGMDKQSTESEKVATVNKIGAVFVGLSYNLKGKTFTFVIRNYLTKWEIGRAEDSDVLINDGSVSRNHAQLVYDNGRWKLIDLMSANGTHINGNKCLTSYLESGDTVRFGKQEFLFRMSDDGVDYPTDTRNSRGIFVLVAFTTIVAAVLVGFFSNSF